MKIAALTDIGSCRQENQDNYCARQLVDGTGWGLVCDGMGGANGGRVASTLATQTMLRYFDHSLRTIENGEEKAFMMRAFDNANRAVYEKATSDPEVLGMGTTGVCALQRGNLAHIVHAGDSRAYLWHGGAIRQLTRDHSMVQQLVDSGQITREQAALHPQKNLITRALGVSANIVPEYNRCEVVPGDLLLLCTDGLTNMVPDAELALLREKHAETEERIKRLVESLSVASDTSAKYVMEQIDALHQESETQQLRLAELETLTEQSRMLHQEFAFHQEMIESFASAVDSATLEEKRRLLRTIVKKVVWDGKNAYVYLFAEDGEADLPPIDQPMYPLGEDSE